MAEEQKYVVTIERMSKSGVGPVVARASGIVNADGLAGMDLAALGKVTDAAVAGIPIEIEPMTSDEINAHRDAQEKVVKETENTLVISLV